MSHFVFLAAKERWNENHPWLDTLLLKNRQWIPTWHLYSTAGDILLHVWFMTLSCWGLEDTLPDKLEKANKLLLRRGSKTSTRMIREGTSPGRWISCRRLLHKPLVGCILNTWRCLQDSRVVTHTCCAWESTRKAAIQSFLQQLQFPSDSLRGFLSSCQSCALPSVLSANTTVTTAVSKRWNRGLALNEMVQKIFLESQNFLEDHR